MLLKTILEELCVYKSKKSVKKGKSVYSWRLVAYTYWFPGITGFFYKCSLIIFNKIPLTLPTMGLDLEIMVCLNSECEHIEVGSLVFLHSFIFKYMKFAYRDVYISNMNVCARTNTRTTSSPLFLFRFTDAFYSLSFSLFLLFLVLSFWLYNWHYIILPIKCPWPFLIYCLTPDVGG